MHQRAVLQHHLQRTTTTVVAVRELDRRCQQPVELDADVAIDADSGKELLVSGRCHGSEAMTRSRRHPPRPKCLRPTVINGDGSLKRVAKRRLGDSCMLSQIGFTHAQRLLVRWPVWWPPVGKCWWLLTGDRTINLAPIRKELNWQQPPRLAEPLRRSRQSAVGSRHSATRLRRGTRSAGRSRHRRRLPTSGSTRGVLGNLCGESGIRRELNWRHTKAGRPG